MAYKTLDYTEWTRLQQAMDQLPEITIQELEGAMNLSVNLVAGLMREYPPESEANRPGRFNDEGEPLPWYERGRGSWRPIKQIPQVTGVRLGVIKVKLQQPKMVIGYKLRPTSQQLGRNWTTEVQKNAEEILGIIGNKVTYMPYVNIAAEQAWFHMARNWITEEKALDAALSEIDLFFKNAIRNILSHLAV